METWHVWMFAAGDNVKFGLPMASTTTLLLWGLIRYKDAYIATGQLDFMYDSVKWPLDYFIKCHSAPSELYVQVWYTLPYNSTIYLCVLTFQNGSLATFTFIWYSFGIITCYLKFLIQYSFCYSCHFIHMLIYNILGQYFNIFTCINGYHLFTDKQTPDPFSVKLGTLYLQVGDGGKDHGVWGRPEDMTMARPSFKIDAEHPGADVAGETAAAMAAGYMAFKEKGNTKATCCKTGCNPLYQELLYSFTIIYSVNWHDSRTWLCVNYMLKLLHCFVGRLGVRYQIADSCQAAVRVCGPEPREVYRFRERGFWLLQVRCLSRH